MSEKNGSISLIFKSLALFFCILVNMMNVLDIDLIEFCTNLCKSMHYSGILICNLLWHCLSVHYTLYLQMYLHFIPRYYITWSRIDFTAVFNVPQEPMVKFPLKEVQSTRTQRPTAGSSYPYVEIMLGDLMSQRITQLQLDQVWTFN